MKHNFSIRDDRVLFTRDQEETELKGVSARGFEIVYKKQYELLFERWYLKDERGIWWFSEGNAKPTVKFVSDDIDNFQIINDEYAKDSDAVFHSVTTHIKIPNSDPSSFQTLGYPEYFAKDKNQVYACGYGYREGLIIFKDADPDTFVNAGYNGFAADRDNLYSYSHELKHSNQSKAIEVLDINQDHRRYDGSHPKNLKLNKKYLYKKFPDIKGWWHPQYDCVPARIGPSRQGYSVKNVVSFYEDVDQLNVPDLVPTIIRSADKNSFVQLDRWYGKDSCRVYYKWFEVTDADPASFKVLTHRLGRDKNQYFYEGRAVEGVDYESFEIIEELCGDYKFAAKDLNSLYFDKFKRLGKYEGYGNLLLAVKNSDPSSFVVFNEAWSKDKNNVYRYGNVYSKADAKTFKSLLSNDTHNHWAKDNTNLYNSNGMRTVKGIDGETFEVLNKFWGKDKDSVFCFLTEKVQSSIDVDSFEVCGKHGRAEDKYKQFWFDKSKGYTELKKAAKRK